MQPAIFTQQQAMLCSFLPEFRLFLPDFAHNLFDFNLRVVASPLVEGMLNGSEKWLEVAVPVQLGGIIGRRFQDSPDRLFVHFSPTK